MSRNNYIVNGITRNINNSSYNVRSGIASKLPVYYGASPGGSSGGSSGTDVDPSTAINIPNPLPTGYMPITIENNIELGNSNVFVLVKGLDLNNNACFIDISQSPFVCNSVNVGADSTQYSFPLSILPQDENGNLKFYIPYIISARIYFSVSNKLSLNVNTGSSGAVTIDDPDGFNTYDANYYTIFDKIELDFQPGSGLYVDCTAVDYFSMPISISLPTSVSTSSDGSIFTTAGTTIDRTTAMQNIVNQFKKSASAATVATWNNLILSYNGYMTGNNIHATQYLRVSSPGKSMTPNDGSNHIFDQNYLNNFTAYGFSFLDFIKNYYAPSTEHTLTIDCSELKSKIDLSNYIFTGNIQENNFVFNNADSNYTISIPMPQSISFFAGSIGSFDYPNNSVGAVLVKFITTLFDVGLLPPIDYTTSPNTPYTGTINATYFTNQKNFNGYYKYNSLLQNQTGLGPWYDLYAQTIHEKIANTIYACPYDDEAKEDGTMQCLPNNLGTLTITLHALGTNQNIPNPFYDPNQYTIIVNIGSNTNCNNPLIIAHQAYHEGATGITLPAKQPMPLLMQICNINYDIFVATSLILPKDNIGSGITITPSGQDSYAISLPGTTCTC